MQTCTHCEGTGFLNLDQAPELDPDDIKGVLQWIATHENHDIQVCNCCGDGEEWYGTPGQHYGPDDPPGDSGPYRYNGGLCECN